MQYGRVYVSHKLSGFFQTHFFFGFNVAYHCAGHGHISGIDVGLHLTGFPNMQFILGFDLTFEFSVNSSGEELVFGGTHLGKKPLLDGILLGVLRAHGFAALFASGASSSQLLHYAA